MTETLVMTPTLPPDDVPVAETAPARRGLVQRTLHDSAYAVTAFPLALVAHVVVITLLALGAALSILIGGVVVGSSRKPTRSKSYF